MVGIAIVAGNLQTNIHIWISYLCIRNNFMHFIIFFLYFRTLCIIVCEIEGMIS